MKIFSILLAAFAFMLNLECTASSNDGHYIVIESNTFTLELFDTENHLIKSYPVGLGLNGMGKTKSGDKKTPIGQYEILWKASRFWETDGGYPIVDGHAFACPDNSFTTDPNKADPDETLWTDAYGGSQAVVMCLNYPNASDIANDYTGSCIEIHASLYGGIGEYCSMGCIRMIPEDARDLYQHIDAGAKVFIR